jgi:hypothetical protein
MLNGFEYNLLTGDSSTAWRVCKRWIEKQIPEYLNTEFKPQPYTCRSRYSAQAHGL